MVKFLLIIGTISEKLITYQIRTDRIVFGLPSVLRSNGNSYLIAMLKSAIAGMSDEEKAIHKFVILNAETEIEKQNYLASNITKGIPIFLQFLTLSFPI